MSAWMYVIGCMQSADVPGPKSQSSLLPLRPHRMLLISPFRGGWTCTQPVVVSLAISARNWAASHSSGALHIESAAGWNPSTSRTLPWIEAISALVSTLNCFAGLPGPEKIPVSVHFQAILFPMSLHSQASLFQPVSQTYHGQPHSRRIGPQKPHGADLRSLYFLSRCCDRIRRASIRCMLLAQFFGGLKSSPLGATASTSLAVVVYHAAVGHVYIVD
jgi:hypothetical protein